MENSEKGKIVYPGEEIGTSEEWLPGEGTFEEDGKIYSCYLGKLEFDEENIEANVKAINPVIELEEGDIIYGSVSKRKSSLINVDIDLVEGESRDILRDIEGSIHISKVSNDYTDDLEQEYLVGDVVRAKIVQVEPTIRLSTEGKNFGVVKGYCSNCRKAAEKKGNKLYCPNCDRTENRKVSNVYGKIKLKGK
ncbi:MAG: exosome complex RNA-binding protein Csl4 [Thermoplasmatota archaeon]